MHASYDIYSSFIGISTVFSLINISILTSNFDTIIRYLSFHRRNFSYFHQHLSLHRSSIPTYPINPFIDSSTHPLINTPTHITMNIYIHLFIADPYFHRPSFYSTALIFSFVINQTIHPSINYPLFYQQLALSRNNHPSTNHPSFTNHFKFINYP